MRKCVTNKGLSAVKSPDGISVRTREFGAEICVTLSNGKLNVTVYQDSALAYDLPQIFEIPILPQAMERDHHTAVWNRRIEHSMRAYWGERCPEVERGCPCCDAWAVFDKANGVMPA